MGSDFFNAAENNHGGLNNQEKILNFKRYLLHLFVKSAILPALLCDGYNMENKYLILIPAYNAETSLGKVIESVVTTLNGSGIRYDLLVVNDGSTDHTEEEALKRHVRIITHQVNSGKGAALKTGFAYAVQNRYTAVITLDADGQHEPSAIPAFIKYYEQTGAEIIMGSRKRSIRSMSPARIFSNWCTSLLLSLRTGCKIPDSQSGFRMIHTELLGKINLKTSRFETESELLILAGRLHARFGFVPIPTIYAGETSHIRHLRDTWFFIKMYFSTMIKR